MRTELRAGSTLETLTPDELEETLGRVLGERFPNRRGPQVERPRNGIACDANGAGVVTVYEVPAGMEFELRSVYITADGKTPAARAVAGYALLRRGVGGVELDEYDFTVTGGGIPQRYKYGADAPYFHERESVAVQFVAVGANLNVLVAAQGILSPLVGVE